MTQLRLISGARAQRMARLFVGVLPLLVIALWSVYLWSGYRWHLPPDAYTYLAAGERLNAGHSLYGPLEPGDRYVLDWQTFAAPLVSPPLVAVLWRPLALLGAWTVFPWWALTIAALVGTYVVVWSRAPLLAAALTVPAMYAFSIEVGVGNLDSFVLAGTLAAWYLWRRDRPSSAMAVAVALAALKVYPVLLVVWLLVVAPARTWRPFLASVGVLLGVGVAGAGLAAHLDYLHVLAVSGSGLPAALLVATGACTVGIIALRRWPAASFVCAVLAMAMAWTLIVLSTVAVPLVAWAGRKRREPSRKSRHALRPPRTA
ncbi:MAG TPA: glycosyltransferase 87 family protein [Candidatus Limnocylindrales bacterium]